MSKNKEKLSPEKLQQLEELRKMMMQHSSGDMNKESVSNIRTRLNVFNPKRWLIAILQGMQNSVKFIDYFIDFVIKKDSQKTNDVVKASRAPIMFGAFVVIFFVLFGVIWAGTAPLDSASYAIGTIVNNTKKKIINHPQGGIIKDIYVKLGDKVRKGDKLLEFDQTRIRAEYENTLNQYRSLVASERRLLAEINSHNEIEYPEFITKDKSIPYVATIIETQNNFFKARNELKLSKKQSLKQKLKQLDKQIEGYKAKIVALEKTVSVTKERLDSTKQLYNKGFAQKAALLDVESRLANAEGESAIAKTEIARLEEEITITEISLINVDNEFVTGALDQLKDTQMKMNQAKESLFAQEDALNRVVIRSPVDGIVNNLNYFTIGSSIPPQQTILEISPVDDKLVIEARIEPRNIDSIHVGLKSKIRFSAFKSRTTPLFTGEVVSLSPDIIVPTQASPKDPTAGGYYLAQIEIDMDDFNAVAKTHNLVLHPGMQAEVQIIKGTRTLLRYLLDPVIDAMFKGFKEK